MRNDFAVFILTYKRPNDQKTYKFLRKHGYTGKLYFIVDDTDETRFDLIKEYGEDSVIVFNKKAVFETVDMFNQSESMASDTCASNFMYEWAVRNGIRYFARCDDDIVEICYRYADDGVLRKKQVDSLDELFTAIVEYMENCDFVFFGPFQNGSYYGGLNGPAFVKGYDHQLSQMIFCNTKNRVKFRGLLYTDLIACLDAGLLGKPFFRFSRLSIQTPKEGENKGGVKETYDSDPNRFIGNSFLLMSHPDSIRLGRRKNGRIFKKVSTQYAFPEIISEKYKK